VAFFHRPGLLAGLDEPFIQHPNLHPQRRVFDFLRINQYRAFLEDARQSSQLRLLFGQGAHRRRSSTALASWPAWLSNALGFTRGGSVDRQILLGGAQLIAQRAQIGLELLDGITLTNFHKLAGAPGLEPPIRPAMDEGHDDKQADGSHVEGCDKGSDPEIVDSIMNAARLCWRLWRPMASIKMTKGYQTVSKQRALSQPRIFFWGPGLAGRLRPLGEGFWCMPRPDRS
jgi:hypothetical protein